MKSVKLQYLLLAFLSFALHVNAAEEIKVAQIITEDHYFEDIPKVLTISRLRQRPKDAPTAATIIDRQMIEDSGIIDLPEIFRLVPGFYVGQNAGFVTNTNHVVSYHGFTDAYARRMQVMLDGRTLYQPLYGGVQWSEIPITLQDIERIEVTRGPNSASYGANAFLGTINIITQSPTGAKKNRVTINHGNGRNEAFYHHSGKVKDLSYWFTAGYKDDDGLKNRLDFKRTKLFSFRANYNPSPQDELSFIGGYAKGDRQEGIIEDSLLARFYRDRTKDTYNHNELVKWTHHFENGNEFYIQAYHALDQFNDTLPTGPLASIGLAPNFQYFDNNHRFQRFDLETQYSYSNKKNLQLAVGASRRKDRLYAPLWMGEDRTDRFTLTRYFAHVQYDPYEQLTLNAGLMMEHNTFTGTNTSPRASVNFHITPKHSVRAAYSQAYRTPSYLEEKFKTSLVFTTAVPNAPNLFQRFFNKGDLSPEKIHSRELGYLGEWKHVNVDLKVFNHTIDQIIQEFDNDDFSDPRQIPGVDAATFLNRGSMDTRGLEAQIKIKISPSTQLLLNHAHMRNFTNNVKANKAEDYTNSMPRNISSFLLSHRNPSNWRFSLAGYYSSSVEALGDGGIVDSNHRIDASVAKKFKLSGIGGEIALNVQNLTDHHFEEFADYNTLRRRAYINVNLDF